MSLALEDIAPQYPLLIPAEEMTNERYHRSEGISKTGLDDIAKDPAVHQWRKNAPVDNTKLEALNMGTALHTLTLEPHLFEQQFAVEPAIDRRTNKGKEAAKEFEQQVQGKIIIKAEDKRKLDLMVASAYAHPAARWLLEQPGQNESSIFWVDDETEETCRCRPDRMLDYDAAGGRHILVDVKKVADMSRFQRHIEEFRYHVQDAMYSDGHKQLTGEYPAFVFLAISETIDCGRYPVRTFTLDFEAKEKGHELYRRDLLKYHACNASGNWGGFETIGRPTWAP